jgi:hypothetical protein
MSVVRLVPKEISDGVHFDPDVSLESMKGRPIARLLIIAEYDDGTFDVEGNCNAGESLFLVEKARHKIVFGANDD